MVTCGGLAIRLGDCTFLRENLTRSNTTLEDQVGQTIAFCGLSRLQGPMAFTYRHLPHWIPEEATVFVTWRLAGSFPAQAGVRAVSSNCGRLTDDTNRSSVLPAFQQPDEQLDRLRSGPVWLQDSRIGSVVVSTLLYGETVRGLYRLHAWVVMPNHVHVVFQPQTAMPPHHAMAQRENRPCGEPDPGAHGEAVLARRVVRPWGAIR